MDDEAWMDLFDNDLSEEPNPDDSDVLAEPSHSSDSAGGQKASGNDVLV